MKLFVDIMLSYCLAKLWSTKQSIEEIARQTVALPGRPWLQLNVGCSDFDNINLYCHIKAPKVIAVGIVSIRRQNDEKTKKMKRQKDKKQEKVLYCDVRAVLHSCDVLNISLSLHQSGYWGHFLFWILGLNAGQDFFLNSSVAGLKGE